MNGYLLVIKPYRYEERNDKWEPILYNEALEFYYNEIELNMRMQKVEEDYEKLFKYSEGVDFEVYSCECKYIPNWGE